MVAKTAMTALLLTAAGIGLSGAGPAPQDPDREDEVRVREAEYEAARLQYELAVALAEGREEDAGDISRQLAELEQHVLQIQLEHERGQVEARLQEIHEEIGRLNEEGRHAEAGHLEREARDLMSHMERRERELHMAEAEHRLQEIHREIDMLHRLGREDEARMLAQEAEELQAALEEEHRTMGRFDQNPHDLERAEIRQRLEEVHHRMQELHELGRHEEADRLLSEVAELMSLAEQDREAPRPHWEDRDAARDLERRLEHAMVAAENLEAAGLSEEAEELRRHVEMQQRRLEEEAAARFEGRPGPDDRIEELTELVHELRGEVHELIDLVRGLHARLDELAGRHDAPPPGRRGVR